MAEGSSNLRAGALLMLAVAAGACEDEVLTMQRPDIGVPDTGADEALPLRAGQVFAYRTTLSYRGVGAMSEGSAVYDLSVTIQSVDDRGRGGTSALSVTATGQNMLDQDWTDDKDFDLWAARLGPARATDAVELAPVTVTLDGPPELPPAPTPKVLPAPDTFFIDVRDMEAIRAAFVAAHPDRRPRVVDPDNNNGNWLFEYEGTDDTIFFYPNAAKRRWMRIEYDPRGFLRSLAEEVGGDQPSDRPRATANLMLTSGPD